MHWIRAILQNIKKCDWLVLKREKLTADIVNEINIKNTEKYLKNQIILCIIYYNALVKKTGRDSKIQEE